MIALVDIPYWWHATIFEIMWLAAGVVGGTITAVNVRDSRQDRPVVKDLRSDPSIHDRHWKMIALAARAREGSQWTRLAICGLITASGLLGVLQANPLHGKTTWTGFIVTVTLVGVAGLTAGRSILDYRQRAEMYELALGRSSVIAAQLRQQALNPPTPQEEP